MDIKIQTSSSVFSTGGGREGRVVMMVRNDSKSSKSSGSLSLSWLKWGCCGLVLWE